MFCLSFVLYLLIILLNWYLLLLRKAHSIREKEQRLVGSESG